MAESSASARSISITRDSIADLEQADGAGGWNWVAGFKGALYGVVFSVIAAIVLSLVTPLPENLPGVGAVRVIDNSADSRAVAPSGEQGADLAAAADGETSASGEGSPSVDDRAVQSAGEGTGSETTPAADQETAATEPSATDATDPATDSETATGSVNAGQTDAAAATSPATDGVASRETGTDSVSVTTEADSQSSDVGTETAAPSDAEQKSTDTTQVAAISPADLGPPPEPVSIDLAGPALAVNARPFDVPSDAPLMAVVLTDASSGAIAKDALPLLTMPLTFSIVPSSPADRDFGLAAREAQHEVLGQIPVQSTEVGGTAGQILTVMDRDRVTLEVNARMSVLDMAVGATMPGDAFGAADPALLSAMLGTIKQHGFAYIDGRRAFGIVDAIPADARGIDYVSIDRMVPKGASPEQIYEVLETTAYRAQREGSAIVVIDSSQDALQALLRWGLERDRRPVWFAPISAVIERRRAGN